VDHLVFSRPHQMHDPGAIRSIRTSIAIRLVLQKNLGYSDAAVSLLFLSLSEE